MDKDKIERFNDKAESIFRPKLKQFGYSLKQVKINYLNEMKWSIHHIYLNTQTKRRIEIWQEPYYTDYGFTFNIYNLDSEEYNILYNVPHEKQDNEELFLYKACEELFSIPEMIDIISAKIWKGFKNIPFHK